MSGTSMADNSLLIGWTNAHLKLLELYKPDCVVVAFENGPCKHRVALHASYKAHRASTPEAFTQQLPKAKELAQAMGAELVMREGFEADDLIANLAVQQVEMGGEAWIASSDKDFICLMLSPRVHLINPNDDWQVRTEEKVIKKWAVTPDKHAGMLALVGDTSDGYAGVPGIGPKTASTLLNTYGGVKELYENLDVVSPPRVQNLLSAHRECVDRNMKLAEFLPMKIDPIRTSPQMDIQQTMAILRDHGLFAHCAKVANYAANA